MMAKLIRALALLICLMMLLPSATALQVGLDDIFDDATPAPTVPTAAEIIPAAGDPSTLIDPSQEPSDDATDVDTDTDELDGTGPDAIFGSDIPKFGDIDAQQTGAAGAAGATGAAVEPTTDATIEPTVEPTVEPTATPEPTVEPAVTPEPSPTVNAPTAADMLVTDIARMAVDLTKKCKFKLSEGKAAPLVDSKLNTYWSNTKKARITITLPAAEVAGGLYLEWAKKPGDFTFVEYNSAGSQINNQDQTMYRGLVGVYPLMPETKKIEITFQKKGNAISTLRVYSEGELPTGIQDWQAPVSKADLMVVVAHQDDEFLYMGGTIPYYNTVEGKAVQVVYMANCGRARYKEALNGLWSVGMTNSPDFAGLPDKLTKTLKDAAKVWSKSKVLEALVGRIRKYKPEVIVTHDLKGEYGHGAHMLIASLMQEAINQATDETKFPSSAGTYGVWQVKKLYLHLYDQNPIVMDWNTVYEELGNKTPSDMAKLGYTAHKSQQKSFKYEVGGKYDNSKFGLAFTTVGEDVEKNDMFENIPEEGAEDVQATGFGLDDEEGLDDESFEDMSDEDFNFEELDEEENFGSVLDNKASGSSATQSETTVVNPPTESTQQNNTAGLLGMVIGVPALLGGTGFGYVGVKGYMRKRRKMLRQEAKEQKTEEI